MFSRFWKRYFWRWKKICRRTFFFCFFLGGGGERGVGCCTRIITILSVLCSVLYAINSTSTQLLFFLILFFWERWVFRYLSVFCCRRHYFWGLYIFFWGVDCGKKCKERERRRAGPGGWVWSAVVCSDLWLGCVAAALDAILVERCSTRLFVVALCIFHTLCMLLNFFVKLRRLLFQQILTKKRCNVTKSNVCFRPLCCCCRSRGGCNPCLVDFLNMSVLRSNLLLPKQFCFF